MILSPALYGHSHKQADRRDQKPVSRGEGRRPRRDNTSETIGRVNDRPQKGLFGFFAPLWFAAGQKSRYLDLLRGLCVAGTNAATALKSVASANERWCCCRIWYLISHSCRSRRPDEDRRRDEAAARQFERRAVSGRPADFVVPKRLPPAVRRSGRPSATGRRRRRSSPGSSGSPRRSSAIDIGPVRTATARVGYEAFMRVSSVFSRLPVQAMAFTAPGKSWTLVGAECRRNMVNKYAKV